MQEKVVITGGPGTGKSTVLTELEKKGFTCMPEVSREITLEAQKQGIEQLFLADPLLFSKRLLEKRYEQFKQADASESNYIFFDRGLHDVIAYLDFQKTAYGTHFTDVIQKCKYERAFILPPWEAIYKSDNERYENFEQALKIYEYLVKTYQKYDYELIEVPFGKVPERVDFILKALNL